MCTLKWRLILQDKKGCRRGSYQRGKTTLTQRWPSQEMRGTTATNLCKMDGCHFHSSSSTAAQPFHTKSTIRPLVLQSPVMQHCHNLHHRLQFLHWLCHAPTPLCSTAIRTITHTWFLLTLPLFSLQFSTHSLPDCSSLFPMQDFPTFAVWLSRRLSWILLHRLLPGKRPSLLNPTLRLCLVFLGFCLWLLVIVLLQRFESESPFTAVSPWRNVEFLPVPFSAIDSCLPVSLPVVNIKGYYELNPVSCVLHLGLPPVCYTTQLPLNLHFSLFRGM